MTSPICREFTRMVKPEHLNAANTLFGGTLVAWIDEASALYAMEQMQTKRIVTLRMSDMVFKKPARQGDILEFSCYKKKVGRSSFTMVCTVRTKRIVPKEEPVDIARCELIFVAVDEEWRPEPFCALGDWRKSAYVRAETILPEKPSTFSVYLVRVGPSAVQLAKLLAGHTTRTMTATDIIGQVRTEREWCLGKDLSKEEADKLKEPFEAIGALIELHENLEYGEPTMVGPRG